MIDNKIKENEILIEKIKESLKDSKDVSFKNDWIEKLQKENQILREVLKNE